MSRPPTYVAVRPTKKVQTRRGAATRSIVSLKHWTSSGRRVARHERKGWLHADHDGDSSVSRDAAELAARDAVDDNHPRTRENTWSVYETSLDYMRRFGDPPTTEPRFARPTAAEIAAAPL